MTVPVFPELYARVPPQAGLEERARAIAAERVQRYRHSPGLLKSLVLLERTRPKSLPRGFAARAATVGSPILDFMKPAFARIAHNDPAAAVARGFYFISAICRERVLFPRSSHAAATPLADDELVDELTRLLIGYLTLAPIAEKTSAVRPVGLRTIRPQRSRMCTRRSTYASGETR